MDSEWGIGSGTAVAHSASSEHTRADFVAACILALGITRALGLDLQCGLVDI